MPGGARTVQSQIRTDGQVGRRLVRPEPAAVCCPLQEPSRRHPGSRRPGAARGPSVVLTWARWYLSRRCIRTVARSAFLCAKDLSRSILRQQVSHCHPLPPQPSHQNPPPASPGPPAAGWLRQPWARLGEWGAKVCRRVAMGMWGQGPQPVPPAPAEMLSEGARWKDLLLLWPLRWATGSPQPPDPGSWDLSAIPRWSLLSLGSMGAGLAPDIPRPAAQTPVGAPCHLWCTEVLSQPRASSPGTSCAAGEVPKGTCAVPVLSPAAPIPPQGQPMAGDTLVLVHGGPQ